MNGQTNAITTPMAGPPAPRARSAVLRALLPVFLVAYVALPLAVVRQSR